MKIKKLTWHYRDHQVYIGFDASEELCFIIKLEGSIWMWSYFTINVLSAIVKKLKSNEYTCNILGENTLELTQKRVQEFYEEIVLAGIEKYNDN